MKKEMKIEQSLNLDKIPIELDFIIKLLIEKPTVLKRMDVSGVNWEYFLRLAYHHRVYPSLYLKMKDALMGYAPPTVLESLEKGYKRNTIHMLKLSSEMIEVHKLFTKHSISSIFLKGPTLAIDLYNELSNRTSSDLDLLINLEDLHLVDKLLLDEGYKKEEYFQTVFNEWKWRNHHFTYIHSKKGHKLEIHWRLNPGLMKEPSFEKLWERRREQMISHMKIPILSREDLFFFLITHGARHGWSRLRWLYDIHLFMNQSLNWINILKLLKEYNCLHIGGQTCLLVNQIFGTHLEEGGKLITKASRNIAQAAIYYLENMISLHSKPLHIEVSRYHQKYTVSLMTSRQKLTFFISTLFPSYLDVQVLPLPKLLYPLYFPLRPFLWIWRKARKPKLSDL